MQSADPPGRAPGAGSAVGWERGCHCLRQALRHLHVCKYGEDVRLERSHLEEETASWGRLPGSLRFQEGNDSPRALGDHGVKRKNPVPAF